MSWGWNEQSYLNVPGVSKVNVVFSPGLITIGVPPSIRTLWVKLSSFVHVTVEPAATVIAVGANLYDFGRSTLVVATELALAAAPELEQPIAASARTANTVAVPAPLPRRRNRRARPVTGPTRTPRNPRSRAGSRRRRRG